MDATIGKGYSVGFTSTMVFCPECHQGVKVSIDGDRADIGDVRTHLQGHYGQHAMVDFQVADMLTKALGFGGGGGVGGGNPDQPNSSLSAGHTTYF